MADFHPEDFLASLEGADRAIADELIARVVDQAPHFREQAIKLIHFLASGVTQRTGNAANVFAVAVEVDPTKRLPGTSNMVTIEHTRSCCDSCGDDVWIGPRQLGYVRAKNANILCGRCMLMYRTIADPTSITQLLLNNTAPRMDVVETREPGSNRIDVDISNATVPVLLPLCTEDVSYEIDGNTLCVACHRPCWLSQYARYMIRSGDTFPLCFDCGKTLLDPMTYGKQASVDGMMHARGVVHGQ